MKKFCLLALLPVFMAAHVYASAPATATTAPAATEAEVDQLGKVLNVAGNVVGKAVSLAGGYVVGSALKTAVGSADGLKFVALAAVGGAAVHTTARAQVLHDVLGDGSSELYEVGAAAGFVLGEKPVQQLWAAAQGLCPCR